ncbi:integrase catalytic domain-containing protein [Trichonephila inaurata madagascariensis]|uniref:Integrase catalytic domain-containing protein n=1 Tax=Trichonephila inaurata madagascariensis TaxID=2747483 RepID=A0A8X6Y6R8_9ARAC|nr:integrase catalytic domain-containing protein [Trichonephila inaurata madagascariensis]
MSQLVMEKRPNLRTEMIPAILNRFCLGKIGVNCEYLLKNNMWGEACFWHFVQSLFVSCSIKLYRKQAPEHLREAAKELKDPMLHPIGLSSDIEKAFLKLNIIPEHKDNLRLYLPLLLKKLEYTDIAKFCLEAVLFHSNSACIDHLENSPARFDDVTQKLKHSFYVDDCVTGVKYNIFLLFDMVKAIEIMAWGYFNLRGWESNVPGHYISRCSGLGCYGI